MKVIECKFPEYSHTYSFKMLIDFEVGDLAVVIAAGRVQVAEVTSTMCSAKSWQCATKWAFQKVDLFELRRLVDEDCSAAAAAARRKEIIGRLESMVKKQDLSERFKSLAESNPVAQTLLAELEELGPWTE